MRIQMDDIDDFPREDNGGIFECDVCYKRYNVLKSLNQHKRKDHNIFKKGPRVVDSPVRDDRMNAIAPVAILNSPSVPLYDVSPALFTNQQSVIGNLNSGRSVGEISFQLMKQAKTKYDAFNTCMQIKHQLSEDVFRDFVKTKKVCIESAYEATRGKMEAHRSQVPTLVASSVDKANEVILLQGNDVGERYGKYLAYKYYNFKYHFSRQFDPEISIVDMMERCLDTAGDIDKIKQLEQMYVEMDFRGLHRKNYQLFNVEITDTIQITVFHKNLIYFASYGGRAVVVSVIAVLLYYCLTHPAVVTPVLKSLLQWYGVGADSLI
jgi:hypothetical protein